MEDEHSSNCNVWEWVNSDRTLNNAKRCSCGLRERQATKANGSYVLHQHGVIPLGMSDEDFLRTLKIKPEEAQ